MKPAPIFLRAEWRRLLMANYEVDPSLLEAYLPHGVELDTWQGRHYVSLVGFMFENTRVLGLKIPWHVNFEEVNLRFYVRRRTPEGYRRGVVFIQEIVPRIAICWVANTLYREHYVAHRMEHLWQEGEDRLNVSYSWLNQSGRQTFAAAAQAESIPLQPDAEETFILEHYWGYSRYSPSKTIEYQVDHPPWEVYPLLSHDIKVDFKSQYGDVWGKALQGIEPTSVFLAEGSAITVAGGRTI